MLLCCAIFSHGGFIFPCWACGVKCRAGDTLVPGASPVPGFILQAGWHTFHQDPGYWKCVRPLSLHHSRACLRQGPVTFRVFLLLVLPCFSSLLLSEASGESVDDLHHVISSPSTLSIVQSPDSGHPHLFSVVFQDCWSSLSKEISFTDLIFLHH